MIIRSAKRRPPPGPRQAARQASARSLGSQAGRQTEGPQKPAANSEGKRAASGHAPEESVSKRRHGEIEPPVPPAPGGGQADKGQTALSSGGPGTSKQCEICFHSGHEWQRCPLVIACQSQTNTGRLLQAALGKAANPSRPWWHKMTAQHPSCVIPGTLITVPGNNDCLFIAVSLAMMDGARKPALDNLPNRGRACRRRFLRELREHVAAGDMLEGLPLLNTVCDEAQPPGHPGQNSEVLERYISRMTVPLGKDPTSDQWGGFAEARAMAHMWNFTLYIVARTSRGECQLFTQSIRPERPRAVACLVYTGGVHFDFLKVESAAVLQPLDG